MATADEDMAPVAASAVRVAATEAVASPSSSVADAAGVPAVKAPLTALTPEIRWHCGPTGLNEAVLSIDFLHPKQERGVATPPQPIVLATGGADKEIKLWRVSAELKDHTGLEFVFSLSGHDRSVNCVRFSPDGTFLASASDDSTIILWTKPKTAAGDWAWDKITSFSDVSRTLLACGHKGDITDLAWSPDSAFLCSTSVDNTSVVWNVEKGEVEERRKDHTQYVQGVAWDPLNEYLVTEGNDRSCRVYSLNGFDPVSRSSSRKVAKKCTCIQTIKTREFPTDACNVGSGAPHPTKEGDGKEGDQEAQSETERKQTAGITADAVTAEETARAAAPKHRMFLDDTCPAFARRPTWTPDGSYFLAPTGVFRSTESSSPVNTVYAFARGNLSEPTLHLPGQEKASLGVRCSPLLYELRQQEDGGSNPTLNFFQTPHRSVFAVITLNTVIIYDTQQMHPICTLKDLHYADLTDVSWSRDGQLLSISSMDGYLSFIQFEEGFFGASVSPADHIEMNQQKMKTMFAIPRLGRKKNKTHPTTDDQNGHAKTPGAARKKAKAATSTVRRKLDVKPSDAPVAISAQPVQQAATPAPPGVNTLQVRKKRKITPMLVHTAAATAATPVQSTPGAAKGAAASTSFTSEVSASVSTEAPQEAPIDPVDGSAGNPITL